MTSPRTENTTTSKPARGLGRGLSALIGENKSSFVQTGENNTMVSTAKLQAGKFQPRSDFDEAALRELADSISKTGIIQPIIVRPKSDGNYEIIAGERRWRAAKMIQLPSVPVVIKEIADKDVMEMSIIENVQRKDLKPLEEAQAYRRLLGEFGYTQDDLARTVGKSRSHITNLLRLLSLPEEVKNLLNNGLLTMGHARALLGCPEPIAIAEQVVAEDLSVRQTEQLAQGLIQESARQIELAPERNAKSGKAKKAGKERAPLQHNELREIEESLSASLDAKVSIKASGRTGEIKISYSSLEQLDGLIQKLS
jgi:ParB family chromosome partitioning protein